MKHYIIFVPGLGDQKIRGQEWAIKTWRLYGVKAEVLPMRWTKGRKFEVKLQRLLDRIDELLEQGYEVSLVGASAGATAAINAFAERPKLHGMVAIGGALNPDGQVNPRTYRANPAFKDAMEQMAKSLDKLDSEERHRIMSIYPLFDRIVAPKNTIVRGALRKQVWTVGHAFTIALMITFRARTVIRFLKRSAKQYESTY